MKSYMQLYAAVRVMWELNAQKSCQDPSSMPHAFVPAWPLTQPSKSRGQRPQSRASCHTPAGAAAPAVWLWLQHHGARPMDMRGALLAKMARGTQGV